MSRPPSAFAAILLATLGLVSCARGRQPAASAAGAAVPAGAPAPIRYADHIWAGDVAPPAGELKSLPRTSQNVKAGEALFGSMNCDGCHGGGGVGAVGPSLSDGRWRYGGRDEEVFSSIFYGRPKGMPAYGGVLGQDGVWLLVAYLKSLPKPDSVPTAGASDDSGAHPGQSSTGASTQ